MLGGATSVGSARSAINEMTIRQNNWTVGAYCASYCRVVTTHHTIEDQSMFPRLRRGDPRLGPVLDRLAAEHAIIHDVLDTLDRALIDFVTDPATGARLQKAADELTDTLRSHLSYEERELTEPLARIRILTERAWTPRRSAVGRSGATRSGRGSAGSAARSRSRCRRPTRRSRRGRRPDRAR